MKHRMIAGVRPWFGGICLRMGLSLIAATFSARILGEWLAEVEMTDVFASLATVPASGWLPAILATGISFSAIAQYDVLFHGWLGTGVSPWRARFSGAASIAVAQTLGLGLATGTLARWRTLPELSLRDSLRVTNYISFSFIAALGALCAVALTMWGRGMPGTNLFAAVASCAILLTVVLSFVPFGYLPFRMPPLRLTIRLLALAAIDTGAAAIALWLLLPADIDVPATVFAGAFLLALSAGFLSGTPGGVGPFEICLIAMLPEVPEPQLLASILSFRIVYYALPAALAVLALAYPLHRQEAPRETWRTTPRLRRAEAGLARLQDHRLQALANTVVVAAPASQSLVSIGDPVCGSHLKPADLRALAELADTRALWPALYKIGARSAATARHQGWKILATSDEAWFDPRTFSVEQPRYRQLRRKLRQAQAEGVRIESPNSLPLAQMSRVAAEWSARSGGERGFSMGRFDPAYVAEQRVFLAWQEDSLLAFVTFHTAPTEWTLDLMRSIDNLPNGVMHALIAYASDEAAASGISRFSLAAMPLSDPPRIAALLGRRPEAQGLRRFKLSFAPKTERLYMAAPSGLQLTLAAIGILLCIRFPGRTATTQRTGSGPQPCRTDNAAMQHCRLIAQLNITSFQASGMRPGTRGTLDMNFMDELKRRRDYNRTVRELRRLPMDVALDLGIYQGDARAIARRAVYGK